MSKQVYFVIAVDLDDKAPFIDDETFSARFSKDEQVWDTDKNEWVEYGDEMELYYEALEILNNTPLSKD